MITAQEALFKSIKNAQKIEIPKEVEEGILDSCNKGCWFYEYNENIDCSTSNLLKSLGYKIDRLTILGKQVTKISWNND